MSRNENEIARLNKLIQKLEQDLYEAEKYMNWDNASEIQEKLADAEYRYSVEYSR